MNFIDNVITATDQRLQDVCSDCGSLAHNSCDTCEKRLCNNCVVTSDILPLSKFCSASCRDEAEESAENNRHT